MDAHAMSAVLFGYSSSALRMCDASGPNQSRRGEEVHPLSESNARLSEEAVASVLWRFLPGHWLHCMGGKGFVKSRLENV